MKKLLMKRLFTSLLLIFLSSSVVTNIMAQSGLFIGTPAYDQNRTYSINEIKSSGFTILIVWTLDIDKNGDLLIAAGSICKDGKYLGDQRFPHFSKDLDIIKSQPTSINRIEMGISFWGSDAYQNVKNLIDAHGTGPETNLYKNFAALKEALPQIDAISNDDEGGSSSYGHNAYDVESTVDFTIMLYDIGFLNSLCPYRRMSDHWVPVAEQVNEARPGAVDMVHLQCYAGGAGNNPCTWQEAFDTIPVYPGLWGGTDHLTPAQVQSRLTDWKNECGLEGGFLWVYDNFRDSPQVEQFGAAVNNSFDINPVIEDLPYPPGRGRLPELLETAVSPDITLSWNAVSGADSYDVYMGSTSPPDYIGNQTSLEYDPQGLDGNTKYFWRIDVLAGEDTITGYEWGFTTIVPVTAATNPIPSDGALNIGTEPLLSYSPGNEVSNYKIYLSIDNPPTSLYAFASDTSFQVSNSLDPNTTYYWKVESLSSDGGSAESDIWSFTTVSGLGISDHMTGSFSLFPNPTSDMVRIQGKESINSFVVYNLIGEKVIEYSNEVPDAINLNSLTRGIYHAVINESFVTKLIKE